MRHKYTPQRFDPATGAQPLEQVWPAIRENAGRHGLASVWLLLQPEQQQIGILTVAAKADGRDPAGGAPSAYPAAPVHPLPQVAQQVA
jgi:hypothetical protein